MDNVKKKIFFEIFIDVLFVAAIIYFTIIGVTKTFPELRKMNNNKETLSEHVCPSSVNCVCNNKECDCEYCFDNKCLERRSITCDAKIINKR